jgi:hypothetical protein
MEPSHSQGEPLWLTAYLFFEGHVYGETADRVIGVGGKDGRQKEGPPTVRGNEVPGPPLRTATRGTGS